MMLAQEKERCTVPSYSVLRMVPKNHPIHKGRERPSVAFIGKLLCQTTMGQPPGNMTKLAQRCSFRLCTLKRAASFNA